MPISLNDVLLGFAAPAATAAAVLLLLRRGRPDGPGCRFAQSLSLAAGFWTGYLLLGLAPLKPTAHWHWLPSAVLVAAVFGPIAHAPRVRSIVRTAIYAVVASVAAWKLAPTFANVEPSKLTQIFVWASIVVVAAGLFEPLARISAGPLLPGLLALICICGSVVVTLSESKLLGQVMGSGAGAMAGITIAAAITFRLPSLTAVSLTFFVFIAGMMWIAKVNSFSNVPTPSYLLIAVSPLANWLCYLPNVRQLVGWRKLAVHSVITLAPAVAAVALAASYSWPSDYGDYT